MPQKAWPISYFQKLIKLLLKEENLKIIIVGGDKEIIKVEQLVEEDKIISLVGKTSILQTAAICSKADLAISNDDCVAHIAAAVGVNIISIFGPTNPKRTAPWGNKNNIFVFKSNLPCSPCYKLYSGVINCKFKDDIKCLKLITPEIVFEKVKYLLNESLNE
jgi:ADP-heptose:LPS heptosyltransferase